MIFSLGSTVGVTIILCAAGALADWQLGTNRQHEANHLDSAILQIQYPYEAFSQTGSIGQSVEKNSLLNRLSLNDQSNVLSPIVVTRGVKDVASLMMTPQETIEFELSMLSLHNILRRNAGLSQLEWSPELAAFAISSMVATEQATQSCPVNGSPQTLRKTIGPFANVGENLFVQDYDNVPTAEDVISSWYNQGMCYRYNMFGNVCINTSSALPRAECNNQQASAATYFTQIMWSTATHVGCAIHKCSTCTTNYCPQYVVRCNYGSTIVPYGGNVAGLVPFDSTVADRLSIPKCNAQQLQKQFLAYHIIKTQNPNVPVQALAQMIAAMESKRPPFAQNDAVYSAMAGISQITGDAPYYKQQSFETGSTLDGSPVAVGTDSLYRTLYSANPRQLSTANQYAQNSAQDAQDAAVLIVEDATSGLDSPVVGQNSFYPMSPRYTLANKFPRIMVRSKFSSPLFQVRSLHDNANMFPIRA